MYSIAISALVTVCVAFSIALTIIIVLNKWNWILFPKHLIIKMIVLYLQAQNDEFAAIFNLEDYKGRHFIIRLFFYLYHMGCML